MERKKIGSRKCSLCRCSHPWMQTCRGRLKFKSSCCIDFTFSNFESHDETTTHSNASDEATSMLSSPKAHFRNFSHLETFHSRNSFSIFSCENCVGSAWKLYLLEADIFGFHRKILVCSKISLKISANFILHGWHHSILSTWRWTFHKVHVLYHHFQ